MPLRVVASVDGREYEARGLGECTHAAEASIYDAPAAVWRAGFTSPDGDLRYLNLTFWQLKAGGTQFSVAVDVGTTSHQIATVKGAQPVGGGTARLAASGQGGALTVDGRDASGTPIRVRVECERFTPLIAEGG